MMRKIPTALAVSTSANFYPEMDEPDAFDGETITWTFTLPRTAEVGAGLFRIEFERILTPEERAMPTSQVLASALEARSGETAQQARSGTDESAVLAQPADAQTEQAA